MGASFGYFRHHQNIMMVPHESVAGMDYHEKGKFSGKIGKELKRGCDYCERKLVQRRGANTGKSPSEEGGGRGIRVKKLVKVRKKVLTKSQSRSAHIIASLFADAQHRKGKRDRIKEGGDDWERKK